jgi:hypothetical protein
MDVTWLSGGWIDRIYLEPNLNTMEEWVKKTIMEMKRYSEIMESNAEGTHSKEISFWESAPCKRSSLAFLTVLPVDQVQDVSLVHVLHVIMDVASSTPSHKVNLGIIGDSKPPLLPIIKQAPTT